MNLRKIGILLAVGLTIQTSPIVSAQSSLDESNGMAVVDEEFDNELASPVVGSKQRTFVRAYMKNVAENLYHEGIEVETMRDGEVVIAIIPTDGLFYPNETVLYERNARVLDKFRPYIGDDGMFKVLVAVHSDNTGSDEYCIDLTEGRVLAILDYLEGRGMVVENVIGFPRGNNDPIVDNSSRANRALNRRVELFIVPDTKLIAMARNKK